MNKLLELVNYVIQSLQNTSGTALVVQWVRLHTPNAGDLGSIPGWGTRSHMHAATKSLHATTKDPTCQNEDSACPN